MDFLKSKKASVSISSIAVIFLELVVFVAFAPSINIMITSALPFLSDNPVGTFLLKGLMLFIVIGLTMSIPKKDQQIGA